MGLFLGPFSGHAVGGGGHGVIDPPPPGADPGSGPRSEVDTANRSPLRLLKTTMNKHQPKFMKVVPPGQQIGTIAPPYAWNPRERDDWAYKMPKPRKLGESELRTDVLPHRPVPPMGAPRRPTAPRRGDTRRIPRPPAPEPAAPKTVAPDPRKARVDAINSEIAQLRKDVRELLIKKRDLAKLERQARASTQQPPRDRTATPPPPGHWKGSAASGYPEPEGGRVWGAPIGDSMERTGLRLLEAKPSLDDLDKLAGPAPEPEKKSFKTVTGPQTSPPVQFSTKADPYVPTRVKGHADLPSNWLNRSERRAQLHDPAPHGLEPGRGRLEPRETTPAAKQFATVATQIAPIDNLLKQKRARIDQLTQELQQLHQQMQTAHESTGLSSKNLRRLDLLLK